MGRPPTLEEVRTANSGLVPGQFIHPLGGEENTIEIWKLDVEEMSPDTTKFSSPVVKGASRTSYVRIEDAISNGRVFIEVDRSAAIRCVRVKRSFGCVGIADAGSDDINGEKSDRKLDFGLARHKNGVLEARFIEVASDQPKHPDEQYTMNALAWAIEREWVRLGFQIIDNDLAGGYMAPQFIESLWENPETGRPPSLEEMIELLKGRRLLVGTERQGIPVFIRANEDGTFTDLRLNTNQFRSSLGGNPIKLLVEGDVVVDLGEYALDGLIKVK